MPVIVLIIFMTRSNTFFAGLGVTPTKEESENTCTESKANAETCQVFKYAGNNILCLRTIWVSLYTNTMYFIFLGYNCE